MPTRLAKRFLLTGRVQGVGCRAQVMDLVEDVGDLSGYVRNLPDGKVEVCVKGADWRVDELERQLRNLLRAPVRIDGVESSEISGDSLPNGFSIRS